MLLYYSQQRSMLLFVVKDNKTIIKCRRSHQTFRGTSEINLLPIPVLSFHYVGTVNGPTSITRLGVWKMYQKVASFSILDTPPPPKKQTLTIFRGGGCKKFF